MATGTAFCNLLSNALKFTEKGTVKQVSLCREENYTLTVTFPLPEADGIKKEMSLMNGCSPTNRTKRLCCKN